MARRTTGFTLIEVVAAMAIVAVALALAVPAFSDAMQRTRTQTTMYLLRADLAMARATAIMRRKAVVVCPRATGGGCRKDSRWNEGWIVFNDPDGNRRPDLGADMLRSEDAPATGDASFDVVSSRPFLRYQPDGRSANSNLTIHVCAGGNVSGQVIVNNSGRARTSREKAGTPCPK